jgi:DNA repair exonuclease SbcCD ATPase subunit
VKYEDFKGLTQTILENLSDQAKISGILMTLNEDYGQQVASLEQLNTQVTELDGNIKSLQQTNMDLFLKVSNPVPKEGGDPTPTDTLSFDDLVSNWK